MSSALDLSRVTTSPHTPDTVDGPGLKTSRDVELELLEDCKATEHWLSLVFAFTLLSTLFQVRPPSHFSIPLSSAAGCLPTPSPSCPT